MWCSLHRLSGAHARTCARWSRWVVAFASFLSHAYLADGNLAGALAEVDRGLNLEGLEANLLRTGLVIALAQAHRAEIGKRLELIPDGTPVSLLNRRLVQFIDAPSGAAAEIRRLASAQARPTRLRWLYGRLTTANRNCRSSCSLKLRPPGPTRAHCGSPCCEKCARCRRSKRSYATWDSSSTGAPTAGPTSVIR